MQRKRYSAEFKREAVKLAGQLDLYSRKVVGWSINANMIAQLAADALMMAIWRRGKPIELLHHSDQGSQYTSEDFQRLLADQGIPCSMSRRGDCWDNAATESFFSTIKRERLDRRNYATRTIRGLHEKGRLYFLCHFFLHYPASEVQKDAEEQETCGIDTSCGSGSGWHGICPDGYV